MIINNSMTQLKLYIKKQYIWNATIYLKPRLLQDVSLLYIYVSSTNVGCILIFIKLHVLRFTFSLV